MKVKKMQQQDIDEVFVIERISNQFPWSLENFQNSLRANHNAWIFRNALNKIQGYVITQAMANELHLLNICVKPEAQGKGLGCAILNHVINYAKTDSYTVIVLEVRSSNNRAQQCYERAGFNKIAVQEEYYPSDNGREDAVLMAIDLSFS